MLKANWQPSKAEFWHRLPAPARPWPSEVKWFEKYVLEKKVEGKNDALILGSTVEFRSMLHQHKLNVHVADFSEEFYHLLTETQKERLVHRGPETFYHVDWRDMELDKKFDLIFGDWVPGVLHTADYDRFYRNIISHLKDDGLFIAREGLRLSAATPDLDQVVKEHYEKYGDQYSFYETSMQFVYGYKVDPVTNMWDIPAAQAAWETVNAKGLLRKEDYDFFVQALAVEKIPASMMIKDEFRHHVSEYFDIIAEHHGAEPSAPWFPIYVMRKKLS